MNIKKILPIISFILLIGAIISATYFKNLEKEITKENMKIEKENSANNVENPTFKER